VADVPSGLVSPHPKKLNRKIVLYTFASFTGKFPLENTINFRPVGGHTWQRSGEHSVPYR
jgi:hypothetical protein